MRYFRTYPWGMQLALFLLMSFTFMSSIGAITMSLFPKLTGFQVAQLNAVTPASPRALVNALVNVQGIQNLFVFLLPAVTFAYLAHPRPTAYLGLRKPGKTIHILLSLLLMAGAMPLLLVIQGLMQSIDFGTAVKKSHEAQQQMSQAIMNMPTITDFLRTFVVMAIVPAFGEELFFRGVLMRFVKKRTMNMVTPILFTAAVFSFSHANVYGYISIFFAGVLLAVIYYLTNSIWCGIAGHLFFNGFQIVLSYMGHNNATIRAFVESDTVPFVYAGIGAVVFALALYLLLKNRTPLAPDWAEDYTPAERSAMQHEKS